MHARRLVVTLLTCAMAGLIMLGADQPDRDALRREFLAEMRYGDYLTAAVLAEDLLALSPDDRFMLYNAACAHSRLGSLAQAELRLRQAVAAGFLEFSRMRRDPDLLALRERAVLRAILLARDAADPLIAERRVADWKTRFDESSYRFERDAERSIDLITPIDAPDVSSDIRSELATITDHLAATIFPVTRRHALLVAVPTPDDAATFFDDGHVHGTYRHESRRLIAAGAGRSLRHELVHALHHDDMDDRGQSHPMWIQEGLACLFETASLSPGGERIAGPSERDGFAKTLAEAGELIPWRRFFRLSAAQFKSSPARTYAQAHSIFTFLATAGQLDAWYHEYTTGYANDPTGATALEHVCNARLKDVESRWQTWLIDRKTEHPPETTLAADDEEPESEAEAEAEAIVQADPAQEIFNEARAQYESGKYEAAITNLLQLLSATSTHTEARYTLALAYVRTNDLTAARQQATILKNQNPNLASLLKNLLP